MQNEEHNKKPGHTLGNSAESILSSLERDWREMCGNELRPTHAALEPLRMDETLHYAFVLKRTGPGKGRIRVAGQRVHDTFNEDLAGLGFDHWFSPKSTDTASELLEAAFTLPAVTPFAIYSKRSLGRGSVRGRVILLPMRDAAGNVSRVLGALVTDGTECPHPLRFEIDHSQEIRCDTQDGSFPDRRYATRAAQDRTPHAGHLRLVVDNA